MAPAGTPGPRSPRGASRRAAPLAAARRSAEGGRSPPGRRPGAAGSRRWPGRPEAERREPPRGAGTSALRRPAARGAGDPDRPRGPGANGTPGAGGAGQRSLKRRLEVKAAEPAVRRQAGLDRDERHEREPGVALRGEIEDVPFPALPADQEVQGVLVEIREVDLQDARRGVRVLGERRRRRQEARGQQYETPHLG